jgi:transposase, IS5 family
MAACGQVSLADALVSERVGRNAVLEALAQQVDWLALGRLVRSLEPSGAGRPPFDPLMMVKALLLQQWYRLSDADLEEALNDRVSFRRFLGLSLEDAAPDHTTLCRFRNRLAAAGLAEALLAAFERQLESRGLVLKQGTMIDATLVRTPFRPGRDGRAPVDADATTTAREGQRGVTYGYKAHVGVDAGSRLIRAVRLTPAHVNESVVAEALVRGDERAVYADKAYAKRARREALRARGIKPRIMHKSWGGGPPLRLWQKRHNALIAARRAGVEQVFASLKRWLGLARVRYCGLVRNAAHLHLVALAYNMKRAWRLTAAQECA